MKEWTVTSFACVAVSALLSGCGAAASDGPSISPQTLVTSITVAAPAPDPPMATNTSAPVKASLTQVVTKPGRYIVGVNIEPGGWRGMLGHSPNPTCTYAITHLDGSRMAGTLTIDGLDYSSMNNPALSLTTLLKQGDVLEIDEEPLVEAWEPCTFWNDTETVSPPIDSDVPWRETQTVNGVLAGKERWRIGQFDYIEHVQRRVHRFDEAELTEMGLWTCQAQSVRLGGEPVREALIKFAGFNSGDADYLISMARKFMCP